MFINLEPTDCLILHYFVGISEAQKHAHHNHWRNKLLSCSLLVATRDASANLVLPSEARRWGRDLFKCLSGVWGEEEASKQVWASEGTDLTSLYQHHWGSEIQSWASQLCSMDLQGAIGSMWSFNWKSFLGHPSVLLLGGNQKFHFLPEILSIPINKYVTRNWITSQNHPLSHLCDVVAGSLAAPGLEKREATESEG